MIDITCAHATVRAAASWCRACAPVALLAVLATSCKDPKKHAAEVIPVTATRVEKRDVPFEVNATGTVEPLQTVAIAAQVGGILTHVYFKEGDDVQRGQLLFQIDPRPFQAALQQAQASLAKDRAQLSTATQNEQRYAQLVQKDYVTQQQYDQAKADAASAQAVVAGDQAQVETAQLNLEYATIRSPISGRAGALLLKEGNLVRASGQTLVVINQIRPILARFAASAVSLPRIRQYERDTLAVTAQPTNGGGGVSTGTLSFLDNAVDTTTGTILMKAQFANTDGALWPGEFVNVAVRLFVEKDAIVVPAAAVMQSQNGTSVFTISADGTAMQRPVVVERQAGDLSVIQKGLTAGETVVTDGQMRVADGTKVQIQQASTGDQPRS